MDGKSLDFASKATSTSSERERLAPPETVRLERQVGELKRHEFRLPEGAGKTPQRRLTSLQRSVSAGIVASMAAIRSAVAGNGAEAFRFMRHFASVRLQTDLMKITPSMIQAARRAEFDYYQKARALGPDRFMPTPDPIIRAMLEAAVKQSEPPAANRTGSIIVEVASTKRRR